ncbi:tellurium resistance TerZ family protein [Nocardia sp. NBC_00508]|uniref:TerD family protein n=1 Tax=Nocardia sp. NBC_00508 TaxID=2975992 RepID=UPI002E8102CB|nr:TerD family protein [Nocardia sp. NBC_00508]WUD65655.1 tellurium resistance TerZ family protein [Nocardia sp. NBC_00508]
MFTTLRDEGGTPLDHVTMALGWDPATRPRWFGRHRKDIDLNAAALLFAADRLVDVVYHEQLSSTDGAVRLHGDSLTGEDEGDDEIITLDLTRIPAEVTTVLFLITCYTGQTFEQIANAYCRLIDSAAGTQIARYDLTGGGDHTGLVLGRVRRTDGLWRFDAVGKGVQARHPVEAIPLLGAYVG